MITSNRQEHLDGVAGVMILYMIYGHVCCWVPEIKQNPIFPRFLFLFMPWFFFKSGMFHRKKNQKELFWGDWKKLLIPYIMFSIIGDLIFDIRYLMEGITDWRQFLIAPIRYVIHQGAVAGNAPLWFLLTLFLVRAIYNSVANRHKYQIFITCVSGGAAYGLYLIGFADFYWIANTLLGLFFYGMGHELAQKQYLPIVSFASLVVYLLLIFTIPTYVDFRSNTMGSGYYLTWLLSSLCGIIAFNNLFKFLPSKIWTLFHYIGQHSMTYFVMHWCVMGILQIILCYILGNYQPEIFFSVYFFAIIVLCPIAEWSLIRSKMAWLLGR